MIIYKTDKNISVEQIKELFFSVDWRVGNKPDKIELNLVWPRPGYKSPSGKWRGIME